MNVPLMLGYMYCARDPEDKKKGQEHMNTFGSSLALDICLTKLMMGAAVAQEKKATYRGGWLFMHACMDACMDAWMHASMHASIHASMFRTCLCHVPNMN